MFLSIIVWAKYADKAKTRGPDIPLIVNTSHQEIFLLSKIIPALSNVNQEILEQNFSSISRLDRDGDN